MTENKRFIVKLLMFVEEQRYGIFEVGGERLFNDEIVGLLNNALEENEQLKRVLSDVAKDHEVTVEDLILWSEGLND